MAVEKIRCAWPAKLARFHIEVPASNIAKILNNYAKIDEDKDDDNDSPCPIPLEKWLTGQKKISYPLWSDWGYEEDNDAKNECEYWNNYEHPLLRNLKKFAEEIKAHGYKKGKTFQIISFIDMEVLEYDEGTDRKSPDNVDVLNSAIQAIVDSLKMLGLNTIAKKKLNNLFVIRMDHFIRLKESTFTNSQSENEQNERE